MTDAEMLAQFVQSRSPEAFGHVVGRHVHLVYSACLRQLRDPIVADQATQGVFVLLARQAARLKGGASLVPWLFVSTRRVCEAAQRLAPARSDAPPPYAAPTDWQALSPHVDEAIDSLPADARDAFLLKYVANWSLRDVANALDVSDQSAGQRISTGVAKLRKWFEARNQFVAPEALVAAIQARMVHAAPASAAYNATLAAVAPPDVPSPAAGLADSVAGARRRQRIVSVVVTSIALLMLAIAAWRVGDYVHKARLAAASQPTTDPAADPQASSQQQQQQQGGPTTGMQNLPPVGDKQLPITRPVKPIDPGIASRFVQAIRENDLDTVQVMVLNDEDIVNAKDPKTGRPVVEIAADLVLWRRQDATKIAHFLIDNGAAAAIHTSARAGHTRHVAMVLTLHPGQLNIKDADGLTALQRAALVPGSSRRPRRWPSCSCNWAQRSTSGPHARSGGSMTCGRRWTRTRRW
jgi:RNA polymerase sigma factor (sigma-70 family)